MRATVRRTRMKEWYEVIREACQICGKSGGCMIHEDGNRVVCIRVESKIMFSERLVSWLHFLKEPIKVDKANVEDYIPAQPKANVDQLHAVYSALLENTTLENSHYDDLTGEKRGMEDHEVVVRSYRSFPQKPWETIKRLKNYVAEETFSGVPGFYTNQFGWTIAGAPSLMVPYRNERNQIVGFQIRVDNPGFKAVLKGTFDDKFTAEIVEKPNLVRVMKNGKLYKEARLELNERIEIMESRNYGSAVLKKGQRYFWMSSANRENGTGAGNPMPVHVAVPSAQLKKWEVGQPHKAKSVWITEGALKADIAVEHMSRLYQTGQLQDSESAPTLLALPGVSTWMNLLPVLSTMETEEVTISYDMDMLSNPQVMMATKQMILKLKEEGYKVNLAMWSEEDGKGIDDCLLQGRYPQIRSM